MAGGGALSITPILLINSQWVPAWMVALSYLPTPSYDRRDEEKYLKTFKVLGRKGKMVGVCVRYVWGRADRRQ